MPTGVVGVPYPGSLGAQGGTPPYTWSLSGQPSWLSVNATTGVLSGTPAAAGQFSFTATVTDSTQPTPLTQSQLFNATVVAGLTITTSSVPSGVVGVAYAVLAPLVAQGGTQPYKWSLSGQPSWLSVNVATGVLSGTPTAAGPFSFTATVTDSTRPTPLTQSQLFNATVAAGLAITTTSVPNGVVGVAYQPGLTAAGGTLPYTWSLSGQPSWLSVDALSGALAGTPTAAGPFRFTAIVTNSSQPAPMTQQHLFSATVGSPFTITTTSLPGGGVGAAYSGNLGASGGQPPYSWSLSGQPSWLSVNSSSGALSGTPTAAGSFNFTATVTDVTQPTPLRYSASFTITVALPALSLSPSQLTFSLQSLTGAPPAVQVVTVSSASPSPVNYAVTVAADASTWLKASPSSGATTGSISVSVLPSQLKAGNNSGTITVAAQDGSASATIAVTAVVSAVPSLTVSPQSISLTLSQGNTAVTTVPISVFAVSSLSSSVTLNYGASVDSGNSFLSIPVGQSGQTPASFAVAINPSNLALGTNLGKIHISATGANPAPAPVDIPVPIPGNAVSPGQLLVAADGSYVTLSAGTGGEPVQGSLSVANSGGGLLHYTAKVLPGTGGNWLTLPSTEGNIVPSGGTALSFSADPSAVPGAGTWKSQIEVDGGGASAIVTVDFAVAQPNPSILLSQTGLTFSLIQGASAPPPQTVDIFNANSGSMVWQAQFTTLPAGGTWLNATGAGTAQPPGAGQTSTLPISIDPTGFKQPGQYYGQVQIKADGANNSPQTITVVVNVLAADQPLSPFTIPSGVVLSPGGSSQQVEVFNPGLYDATFTATVVQDSGSAAPWLSVIPASGTVPKGRSLQLALAAQTAGLQPGANRAQLVMAFDDGSVQRVAVLAVVPAGGAQSNAAFPSARSHQAASPGCSPNQLYSTWVSPGAGANIIVLQPVSLVVQVNDNCQNPLTAGSVVVNLPQSSLLTLNPQGNGQWSATWAPPAGIDPQVELAVTAQTYFMNANTLYTVNPAYLNLYVESGNEGTAPPVVKSVVNAATFADSGAVAPGSFVTLYGLNWSTGSHTADGLPLLSSLNGTQVTLDGAPLPMQFAGQPAADYQINALVPWDLAPNVPHQLIVQYGDRASVGIPVTVAGIDPGVFTFPGPQHYGAVIIASGDNSGAVAAPSGAIPNRLSQPVKKGQYITIYCTGLGAVDQTPADGAAAPSSPLDATIATPVISIGGANVPASPQDFSGLAPGFAGLYQINVKVPDNAPSGDMIPLTVSIVGATSPVVNIAI